MFVVYQVKPEREGRCTSRETEPKRRTSVIQSARPGQQPNA
jgi:hypothetical protein